MATVWLPVKVAGVKFRPLTENLCTDDISSQTPESKASGKWTSQLVVGLEAYVS